MPEHPVHAAVDALRRGRMVFVTDAARPDAMGACVVAASRITPAHVTFMASEARGIVAVAISRLRSQRLGLRPQAPTSRHPRADTVLVSVEARTGVSTGISAADRARTIRVVADERTDADDLITPGHIIPVAVGRRGVFSRRRVPEAATDLARLAGFPPVAAYTKVLRADGEAATAAEITALAAAHGHPVVDIDDIVRFRLKQEILVTRETEAPYHTRHGAFRLNVYRTEFSADEDATPRHLALVMGEVGHGAPLVRVHSQCLTGDVFGSLRCDCGAQLDLALERIAAEGRGVLVYLLQEGRGIGLANKVRAYALQDTGQDTVEANLSLGFAADLRDFGVAAQVLADLGVSSCRLLTNNPSKVDGLRSFGLEVTERIGVEAAPDPHTEPYLRAKRDKLGHLLERI